MSKPNLVLIAGCNGSGKSTYASTILATKLKIFDADKRKKEIYNNFPFDFEFREQMAWNKTQEEFETQIKDSLVRKKDFAFETNFHSDPMFWVNRFRAADFAVHLMFFCLKSTSLAKERVAIRYQNGGHYVNDEEIIQRYHLGFANLDRYFNVFESVLLLESSRENVKPEVLLYFSNNQLIKINKALPLYIRRQCPQLTQHFKLLKRENLKAKKEIKRRVKK